MKTVIISIFLLFALHGAAQIDRDSGFIMLTVSDTSLASLDSIVILPAAQSPNRGRETLIAGVHITGYAGTMFLLGQAWYKDYPRTSFQVFNDSKEWLQLDKAGHVWTAYNIAKYSKGLWSWAGIPHSRAVWLGGISSIGYQTILEYLDAHSEEWGWSWADMGSNFIGSAMYVSQELAWKEQRFQLKFSSHRVSYQPGLEQRADDLYGATLSERILKDYNGQTYWLSVNLNSFNEKYTLPKWLNLAIGYGATGVFGGFENIGYDKSGTLTFNRTDIARQRQWYLSPDVDFTKIKTGRRGVKTLFSLLNMIKMPAPALELSGGKLKGYLLFF